MKTNILTVLMFLVSITGFAQIEEQQIPEDTVIKIGTLNNGLKYYVRKCNANDKKVEIRLVINAGSACENDNERGLAHFVEHLQFRGTKHFPDSGIKDYLTHCGVSFGYDLNALTSSEKVLYMISSLPLTSEERLDSCMLILRDWAGDATMTDEAVNSERGAVLSEWRQRTGGSLSDELYEFSNYGTAFEKRIPLGDMDVIRNCSPQLVRDFYKRWYEPQNMAVIIMGDIDADQVEAKVKHLFGDLKRGKNIPDTSRMKMTLGAPRFFIHKDKAARLSTISLNFLFPAMTTDDLKTIGGMERHRIHERIAHAIRERLEKTVEMCPEIFNSNVLKMQFQGFYQFPECMSVTAIFNPKKRKDAIETVCKIIERIHRNGLTPEEWDVNKETSWTDKNGNILTSTVSIAYNADSTALNYSDSTICQYDYKRPAEWASQCIGNYFGVRYLVSDVHANETAKYLKRAVPTEKIKKELDIMLEHFLIVYKGTEADEMPEEKELLDIMKKVRNMSDEELNASVMENAKEKPVAFVNKMEVNTAAGKVKKVKARKDGFTEYVLTNGVRVFLQVDTTAKDVAVKYGRKGGCSLFDNDNLCYTYNSHSLVQRYGTEDWRLLCSIGSFDEVLGYNDNSIETKLKALYCTLTSTEVDTVAFYKQKTQRVKYAPYMQNNEGQTRMNNVFRNDISRLLPPSEEQLSEMTIDKFVELMKDYKSNYNGAVVVMSGNFSVDSVMPVILKYMGALPFKDKPMDIVDRWEDHMKMVDDVYVDTLRNTNSSLAEANIFYTWEKGYRYTPESHALTILLNSVMNKLLFDTIRIKNGDVYTPSCYFKEEALPTNQLYYNVVLQCKPDKWEKVAKDADDLLHEIVTGDLITQDMIDGFVEVIKAKAPKYNDNSDSRVSALFDNLMYGVHIDNSDISYYEKVTPAMLKAHLKNILKKGHRNIGVRISQ